MSSSFPEGRQGTRLPASNAAWIAAVVLLLAAPVFYLAWKHPKPVAVEGTPSSPVPSHPVGVDIQSYEIAAHQNPSEANRLNLSMAYIQGGSPGRALPILEALKVEDVKNALVWNNLCVAHVETRDLGAAVEECTHAVALDPGFRLSQNNLAWARQEFASEQAALIELEQTPPGSRDEQFAVQKSAHLIHLGRYDEAIQALDGALAVNPHDANAVINMGTALMLKRSPGQAQIWFRKAVEWNPESQLAKNDLAWSQQR